MARSLTALGVLLPTCVALAAPAPEPFVSGWSKPADPCRDCKISRHNGTLIIEMPGTDHDYDPIRERSNAPQLFRDLARNFDLQVRVRIDCRPSSQSTVKSQPPFVSAGFLLIYPNISRTTCIRLEYGVLQQGAGLDKFDVAPMLPCPQLECASRKGIGEDGFVALKHWYCKKRQLDKTWDRRGQEQFHAIWDRGWKNWPLLNKIESTYLRLEQQGEWINFFMSPDGKNWTKLFEQPRLPAKCKMGLAAYTTSSEPSKVHFDQLKFARGKEKDPSKDLLGGPHNYQARRP